MRLLKCYGDKCVKGDIKHPPETLVKVGGKNYCQECLIIHNKNKAERARLYNYVCEVFDIPQITGHMMKQIKTFKEEYNIPYIEQLYTINYVLERTDLNVDIKYGVAFIGAYHQAMLSDLEDMMEQRKAIEEFKEQAPKYVKIKPTQETKNDNLQEVEMDDLF